MRSLRAAALLLVLVVVLTSCLRYESTIKVDDDGNLTTTRLLSGEISDLKENFSALAAVPEGSIPQLADGPFCDYVLDEFADTANGLLLRDASAEFGTYNDDGFCGISSKQELPASLDQSAAVSEFLETSAQLFKDGESWQFSATLGREQVVALGELAMYNDLLIRPGSDAAGLEWTITVELPGRAVEHNADSVDGGRFTWKVNGDDGTRLLFAQTEPKSFSIGVVTIAAVLATLIGVAALGWFFLRDETKSEPAWLQAAKSEVADTNTAPMRAHAPAVPQPEPFFDAATNAWLIDDPVRGRLRHDASTNEWVPAGPINRVSD